MQRRIQAVAVALVGLVSAGALACPQGQGGFALSLGPIGFALGFNAQVAPCPLPVAPPPMVMAQPMYQGPVYAPPPMVVAPQAYVYSPPPVVVAPPQVIYSPPPVVVAPVAVPVPAPAPVAAPAPAPPSTVFTTPARPLERERPARLAIKYTPGANAAVSVTDQLALSNPTFAHSVGLELRLSRYFALRSDLELRPSGRSWDVLGVKAWFIPDWPLQPYASVSLSGSETPTQPGLLIGVVGALGIDLMIGRHFFLEAEARYRVAPGDCCREVPQLTAVIGAGIAFL